MRLEELLSKKSSTIRKIWLRSILETYPDDSQRFLKEQKDRFANPVRHTFFEEIGNLLNELVEDLNTKKITPILDRIIRIRAVQDFTPSQAVSFIFLLKKVVRNTFKKEIQEEGLLENLLSFESKIDELALMGFDIYMKRKEKLYELRANEAKNQVSGLLERMGLVSEISKWAPDHQGEKFI